jgi:hypothetical protein
LPPAKVLPEMVHFESICFKQVKEIGRLLAAGAQFLWQKGEKTESACCNRLYPRRKSECRSELTIADLGEKRA